MTTESAEAVGALLGLFVLAVVLVYGGSASRDAKPANVAPVCSACERPW